MQTIKINVKDGICMQNSVFTACMIYVSHVDSILLVHSIVGINQFDENIKQVPTTNYQK